MFVHRLGCLGFCQATVDRHANADPVRILSARRCAKSSSVKQEQSDISHIPSPPFTFLGSVLDCSFLPYSEEDGNEIIGIYSRNSLIKNRADASTCIPNILSFM